FACHSELIRSYLNRSDPVRSASNGPERSEGAQGKLPEDPHDKLREESLLARDRLREAAALKIMLWQALSSGSSSGSVTV
ncbi:MAG: hypothetical protein ACRD22_01565, partial [Terriglobia bacterium]